MALSNLSRLRDIARATMPVAASRRELTYEPVDADGLPLDTRLPAIDLPGARLHQTEHGACLVIEHLFDPDRSHGCVHVRECGAVCLDDTLDLLAGRALRPGAGVAGTGTAGIGTAGIGTTLPSRLVYFDLETTGLSGGAGTLAFLAGVGEWTRDGFRTTQYLLPSYASERAMLHALNAYLGDTAVLVTYNGRTFDVPVMEVRGELHRVPQTVCTMPHLDMLHAARRLWRGSDEGDRSCRLVHLEESVLGVGRAGDVAGFEIPRRYFEFVRGGSAEPLEPVLLHNRLDLLSLAALTQHAQRLVRDGREMAPAGAVAFGLGALYERGGWQEAAVRCYRAASEDAWQPRDVRRASARALARLLRRQRRYPDAAAAWQLVLQMGGRPQMLREAREALAIHHEHRAGQLDEARRHAVAGVEDAIGRADRERFGRRLARLERKLARTNPGTPLWED